MISSVAGSVGSSIAIGWVIKVRLFLDFGGSSSSPMRQLPCFEFSRPKPCATLPGHGLPLNLRFLCWNFHASVEWFNSVSEMVSDFLRVSSLQLRPISSNAVMASSEEIKALRKEFDAILVILLYAILRHIALSLPSFSSSSRMLQDPILSKRFAIVSTLFDYRGMDRVRIRGVCLVLAAKFNMTDESVSWKKVGIGNHNHHQVLTLCRRPIGACQIQICLGSQHKTLYICINWLLLSSGTSASCSI